MSRPDKYPNPYDTLQEAVEKVSWWEHYDNYATGTYKDENAGDGYSKGIIIFNSTVTAYKDNEEVDKYNRFGARPAEHLFHGDLSIRRMVNLIEMARRYDLEMRFYTEILTGLHNTTPTVIVSPDPGRAYISKVMVGYLIEWPDYSQIKELLKDELVLIRLEGNKEAIE